ncbi:hypothetical protein DH2020_048291 [Rehmannia glutinosa]|uniref:Uncharacterized protein n=1 Tax=Rehmannia glutinosa TaxID=99300 RepID=A0ABR0U6R6_REHGL
MVQDTRGMSVLYGTPQCRRALGTTYGLQQPMDKQRAIDNSEARAAALQTKWSAYDQDKRRSSDIHHGPIHGGPSGPALTTAHIALIAGPLFSQLKPKLQRRPRWSPDLLSKLQIEFEALSRTLSELKEELVSHLTRHSSYSNRVGSLFSNVHAQLDDLRLSSTQPPSEGGSRRGMGRSYRHWPRKWQSRNCQKLRSYLWSSEVESWLLVHNSLLRFNILSKDSKTALKLDTLVGDIEDVVSSTMNRTLRRHPSTNNLEVMRVVFLRTLKLTEDMLSLVIKTYPQWTRLVSAVDHRIDRALAILRPQAIADHRALLASLGWPHPELQRKRKSRQLEGHYKDVALHQPLWVIEELVNPISIASQRHFSKWIENPEYIFALVYKITRDYVDSMDDLLQPLVDEAMLTESDTEMQSQAKISWLHLVDLMIAFDKRVQSLAAHSGILLSVQEDGNCKKMSSLTVFCDRPDWLDLWAEIELNDALYKLKSQMEDERNWINEGQKVGLLSGQEENKSPLASTAVFRRLSSVIDRCRSLPSSSLRSRFVKSTGGPIIYKFLDCLKQRCQEAEGLTALTDDNALTKVAKSVNAARHFESVFKELCEDVFFLEMEFETADDQEAPDNGIFHEEIKKLEKFRTEWIEKLSTGVERVWNDLTVLFGVFGAWCLRPEGFFPKVNDGLKLLRTAKKQLKNSLIVEERWLRDNGIKHLTAAEVERIMKNRVFTS